MVRFYLIVTVICLLVGCGTSSNISSDVPTDSPPIVSRVNPDTASIGDEITVFGLGFSIAAPMNIVVIGSAATSAATYTLLENPTDTEIESLTITVPNDAVEGNNSVIVIVDGNTSNSDITLTVNP